MSENGTLSACLRRLIDASHGGSVNALAMDAGVPQRTLARLVSGQLGSPRVNFIASLADYYAVPLGSLLDGTAEVSVQRRRAIQRERVIRQIEKLARQIPGWQWTRDEHSLTIRW
jgi:transcriptional regulator with XRE-family HTH domain